jgi:excisionase family DNA binding protein
MRNDKNIKRFKTTENNTPITDTSEVRKLPVMKSLKEMAELTGFSYMHLRNLCLRNEIVHIRAGSKYLINYDRFIDYLNGVKV